MLDRTLDKKLKEIHEQKIILDKQKDIKKSATSIKTHIDKPATINFKQKPPKTSNEKSIIVTSDKKETVQTYHSPFIKVLSNSIQDIEDGILLAGITEIQTNKVIFQKTSTQAYTLSVLGNFINQYLNLIDDHSSKEKFLLIHLEKDMFLYIQIFKRYYYTILIDQNNLSIGHVLNILKPELIKNYNNLKLK